MKNDCPDSGCFVTFSRQGFYTTADPTYAAIMFQQLLDASNYAEWDKTDDGRDYFYTDDVIGVDLVDDKYPGPGIQFAVGNNKLQGRILSKGYGTQHCAMEIDAPKAISGTTCTMDIRQINPAKLRLFGTAYDEYFTQVIWRVGNNAPNDYVKLVGKLIYRYYDVTCNIAKVIDS